MAGFESQFLFNKNDLWKFVLPIRMFRLEPSTSTAGSGSRWSKELNSFIPGLRLVFMLSNNDRVDVVFMKLLDVNVRVRFLPLPDTWQQSSVLLETLVFPIDPLIQNR